MKKPQAEQHPTHAGHPAEARPADQDSAWKEALDKFFQPFLELLFPRVAEAIDWNQPVTSLNTELQKLAPDSASGRLYADKLVEVTLHSGEQEWLLVHVEVQGAAQQGFNERMFLYHFRIWNQYRKPVISLAVLTDKNSRFRPGLYENRLKALGQVLSFQFPSVKLLDWMDRQKELEQHPNPFAVVLLAQLHVMRYSNKQNEQRLAAKKHLTRLLFEQGYGKQQIRRLYILIDRLITLPKKLKADYSRYIDLLQEEKNVAFISTIEERGIEKGIQQAKALLAQERQQLTAEKRRLTAEKKRTEAERQQAEAEKQQAEAEKQQAEAARQQAEAARQQVEAEKQQVEAARRQVEAARQQAEAEKQQVVKVSISKFMELGMSLGQAAEILNISEQEARNAIQS